MVKWMQYKSNKEKPKMLGSKSASGRNLDKPKMKVSKNASRPNKDNPK